MLDRLQLVVETQLFSLLHGVRTSPTRFPLPFRLLGFPDRGRQPVGRRFRVGPPIGRRAAALASARRRERPLGRDPIPRRRHLESRKPPRGRTGRDRNVAVGWALPTTTQRCTVGAVCQQPAFGGSVFNANCVAVHSPGLEATPGLGDHHPPGTPTGFCRG